MRCHWNHDPNATGDPIESLAPALSAAGLLPPCHTDAFIRQAATAPDVRNSIRNGCRSRGHPGQHSDQPHALNLLTALEAAWEAALAANPSGSERRLATRRLNRLRSERAAGTWLTLGPPGGPNLLVTPRLWWWSDRELGAGKRVAIVSSRVGRPGRQLAPWLATLRDVCRQLAAAGDHWISSPGSTTHRWLVRCGALLDVVWQPLVVADRQPDRLASWLRQRVQQPIQQRLPQRLPQRTGQRIRQTGQAAAPAPAWHVSPAWGDIASPDAGQAATEFATTSWPARDAALLTAAEQLIVLQLRRGGHWWSLLQAWSELDWRQRADVFLAVGRGLVAEELARELAPLGVRIWQGEAGCTRRPERTIRRPAPQALPPDPLQSGRCGDSAGPDVAGSFPSTPQVCRLPAQESAKVDTDAGGITASDIPGGGITEGNITAGGIRAGDITGAAERTGDAPVDGRIVPLPGAGDQWLTHCTRRRDGPWPDQTEAEYLDEWLLRPESVEHSAEAVLRRIVRDRRLLASSKGIRGGFAVVAFTAVAPDRLGQLRRFRRHRSRWDFEPYGLAIRRDWLLAQGARPVIYGEEADWESLPPLDRPFFQRRRSGDTGQGELDWSVEQEWRCLGDVDLRPLREDQVLILVPSLAVARRFASRGGWPVALPGENSR